VLKAAQWLNLALCAEIMIFKSVHYKQLILFLTPSVIAAEINGKNKTNDKITSNNYKYRNYSNNW
jgi:hypothetical protein